MLTSQHQNEALTWTSMPGWAPQTQGGW